MPGVLKCKYKLNHVQNLLDFYQNDYILFTLFIYLYLFAVPTEIEIVRKETFNNWYKVRTYFLANTLTTTPIHVRHTFKEKNNLPQCL